MGLPAKVVPVKELWTALVKLLTPPSESCDTECFTNVVAWANGPDDYRATISRLFEKSRCFVLDVEQCKLIADFEEIGEELPEQVERATIQPEGCIFGALHYYPSRPS